MNNWVAWKTYDKLGHAKYSTMSNVQGVVEDQVDQLH